MRCWAAGWRLSTTPHMPGSNLEQTTDTIDDRHPLGRSVRVRRLVELEADSTGPMVELMNPTARQ